MSKDYSQTKLEKLIAASAPEPIASEGLKLQILREARRDRSRLQACSQLIAVFASCLLLFVFTEASLHSVGQVSREVALSLSRKPAALELCQLELTGEEIGSWAHVEAVLKYRGELRRYLGPLSSASTVAQIPVEVSVF